VTDHHRPPSSLAGTAWPTQHQGHHGDVAGWGGLLMLISKGCRGARLAGSSTGSFCVDHRCTTPCAEAGRRLYVIEGLYVYHFPGLISGPEDGPLRPCPREKKRRAVAGCRTRKVKIR